MVLQLGANDGLRGGSLATVRSNLEAMIDAARAANANLVTLTGDSHNAWAFDLADKSGPIGVEFAGQSVSSYGFERRFNGNAAQLAADFMATNPNLKWMDTSQRGYFTIKFVF